MFCNYCGGQNPEDALFCSKCGRAIPRQQERLEPQPSEGFSHQTEQQKPQQSAAQTQSQDLKRKVRRHQVRLWLAVTFLTLVLFAAGLLGTQRSTGKSSTVAPALLVAIIWVVIARTQLTKLQNQYFAFEEAQGNRYIRGNAQMARRGLYLVAIALGCISFGWGNHIAWKKARWESLLARASELGNRNTQRRSQLAAIRQVEAATFVEYVQQCRELEPLLDDVERTLHEAHEIYDAMDELGLEPSVRETMTLMRKVANVEAEILALLRQEVFHANKLSALPPREQDAYYTAIIEPIRREQERLANEELSMLREAERRGIKLPSDVSEQLK